MATSGWGKLGNASSRWCACGSGYFAYSTVWRRKWGELGGYKLCRDSALMVSRQPIGRLAVRYILLQQSKRRMHWETEESVERMQRRKSIF